MANTRLFHRSFAGGEITPELFGRIDADRYQTGASRVRNMVCKPQGPVQSRPGMQFVREVKDSTKKVRIIPFRYSNSDSYAIELGVGYIRFHQSGETLTNTGYVYPAYKSSKDLQSASTGTDVITLATSHTFVSGDPVRFTVQTAGTNVLPSPLRAGVTYYVRVVSPTQISLATTAAKAQSVLASDLIKLYSVGSNLSGCRVHYRYTAGDVVTHTPPAGTLGTYACNTNLPLFHVEFPPLQTSTTPWYRMPADGTYEINFSVQESWLADIHYVQSNDVLTLVHPSFSPVELRRYGPRKWAVEAVNFKPSCATPVDPVVVPRYGERANVDNWQSFAKNDFSVTPVNQPMLAVFTSGLGRRPFAAGEVLWVSDTKWQLVDDKRWVIYGDTASGGSSISTSNVMFLQNYETLEVFTFNTELGLSTITNSGGHVLITMPQDHGYELGAVINFEIEGGTSVSNLSPATVYYVVPQSATTFKVSTTDPLIGAATYVAFTTTNVSNRMRVVLIGGVVQSISEISSLDNSYKITAVHVDKSESEPTAELTVRNNIYSYGAFNSFTWRYVVGADPAGSGTEFKRPSSFNIYRKDLGAYGLIGKVGIFDTETTTVTISYDQYIRVNWPNHPLQDNDAVSFEQISGGSALAGLAQNYIYYVKRITSGSYSGQLLLLLKPDGDEVLASSNPNVTCVIRREYCFRDDAGAVDVGESTPIRDNAFSGANTYPAAVSYFEQRRVFAGSNLLPQNVWMTKTSTESDLSYRIPSISDDRIAFRMAAREGFRIQHVVPMSSLLLLTESGEWRVTSIDTDAISPTSLSVRPQSYVGSNNVQPAVINNIVLFAAARGGHVRELGFSNEQQSYSTGDLSLRAAHLFDDYQIVDLALSKAPLPIVWCVSSNGRLLGLTYIPEERITGWHWHDTDGTFESICVIPEGEEDRVYACVKRNINGTDKRYIERMAPFKVQALADVRYSDSWKAYSGAATTTITGLSHLENKTVIVLADGKIHPSRTVASGSITLDYAASNVAVGLPYTAELHTLPAIMQVDGFGTGRTKNVGRTWIRVSESPGFQVGTDQGGLTPSSSAVDGASLASGVIEATLLPAWTQDGQVIIQQQNPVPLTVIGMTFEVSVGA